MSMKLENAKKTTTSSEFKSSQWKIYRKDQIRPGGQGMNFAACLTCDDGLKLFSSLSIYYELLHRFNGFTGRPRMTTDQFDVISKNSKLFMLDEDEVNLVFFNYIRLGEQVMAMGRRGVVEKPYLHDVKSFSKLRQKHFYIRTVTWTPIQTESHRRVFAEEILEILETLLEGRQSGKIGKYEKVWKLDGRRQLTLSLDELKRVLEAFDVDKSRITLIPDFSDVLTTRLMVEASGDPSIFVHYEKSETLMSSCQAMFKLFQSIICAIDWNSSPPHHECSLGAQSKLCSAQHKSGILAELKRYQTMKDGVFVSCEELDAVVKKLKANCNYSSRKWSDTQPPIVKLFDAKLDDSIAMSFFLEECEAFQISMFRRPEVVVEEKSGILPVWKARLLFMWAWLELFFGHEHRKTKEILKRTAMFRIPFVGEFEKEVELKDLVLFVIDKEFVQQGCSKTEKLAIHEFMKSMKTNRPWIIAGQCHRWNDSLEILAGILKDSPEDSESKKTLETQKLKVEGLDDSESKKSNQKTPKTTPTSQSSPNSESPIQKTSGIEKKLENVKIGDADQKTPQKTPEDPKSTSEPQNQKTSEDSSPIGLKTSESKNSNQKTSKMTPESRNPAKESANCDKCYRTCEMLNETKKELKTMEIKLEKLEKKKTSKERELMELTANEEKKMEEKEKEIENIRNQVLTLESSISEMRIENLRKEETFKERQKHLEEQISNLESELNEEKKKKKTSEFESEILEKNRQIEELTIRMRTENEMSQRMIQQLMDKLTSSEARYSRKTTTTMTSSSSGIRKCEICWNEMTSEPYIQCHQCRRPFHQKCACNWLKDYKHCPSCEGVFQDSNHSSSS